MPREETATLSICKTQTRPIAEFIAFYDDRDPLSTVPTLGTATSKLMSDNSAKTNVSRRDLKITME